MMLSFSHVLVCRQSARRDTTRVHGGGLVLA